MISLGTRPSHAETVRCSGGGGSPTKCYVIMYHGRLVVASGLPGRHLCIAEVVMRV